MQTLYEILEVSEKASKEVIEKAYKVLAKKYHPDLQTDDKKQEAEKKMKQINEAYSVLSDEFKRSQYDEELMKKRKLEENKINQEISYTKTTNTQTPYNENIKSHQENFHEEKVQNIPQEEYEAILKMQQEQLKRQQKMQQEQIKQRQKVQQDYERKYQNAYENYLRSLGYKIKYKWTWKNYRDFIITIAILILIAIALWFFPPTHQLFIDFYEQNSIFKAIVDILKNIFVGIWNGITSIFK